MRGHAAVLVLALGALLLTPGAAGVPDVPGDPTPPVVTMTITGTLGDAGWYKSNTTVNWSVVDPESIILSTSGCDTRTLNTDTQATRLACTAESDGGETTIAKTFKVDKTAPATTATPSRPADVNGWYNHELSVDFDGSDSTSGLASCSPDAPYEGPDTAAGIVSGTCRDQAGNTAPATLPLKYDETAPQLSPAARPPDKNGWHNHAVTVTFQGTDGTSGVATCTQTTYAGPDDPSVALTGTCLDQAGNESPSALYTTKYDETPPQATATASPSDHNGWHNEPLTVTYSGGDAMSGLESCDPIESYGGPDSATATISGECRDLAGNKAVRSVVVRYDATAPQVTATPARAPNAAGWYRAPLSVTLTGADPVSGGVTCVQPPEYSGPDSATASVAGNCSDQAGNVQAKSFGLKYDETAPQATATPSRQPNGNGWFNTALTVAFTGTDAISGIGPCDAAKTYSAPDTATASLSGTCRDLAGNESAAASYGFKYDSTAPVATATASRPPNANLWYRAPLDVSFAATDALSGPPTCEAAKSYGGPDSGAAVVSGTCTDKAGNNGAASLTLKYDSTAPVATATASRPPNANLWYRAPLDVSFAATDALSGPPTCEAAKSYGGPDSGAAVVSGTCTDKAGNNGAASLTLKYDSTAPVATATASRPPNANLWYRAPLDVSFAATDALSGPPTCEAAKSYGGPDSGAAVVSGTCTDKAGNNGAASLTLKYDSTAPVATATASRPPNANLWYRAPLDVSFAATDALSGPPTCEAAKSYGGPDSGAAVVSGTCTDKAGNNGAASLTLKYDSTAPVATATASRPPNANLWYRAPLDVSFAATDALSGPPTCEAAKSYGGPDSGAAVVSGTCTDKAGNNGAASLTLKYDSTAPVATATASRPPNANLWYRAPLDVSFAATDALSGFESCDATKSYTGPDTASTAVSGACRDNAGNSATASVQLKYDATKPQATAAPSRQPNVNGWFNAALTVSFTGGDAMSGIGSCDLGKTYSTPDAANAALSGTCLDRAGNESTPAAYAFKYDSAPPLASAAPSRPPNANGWYRASLDVTFAATDGLSGFDSCDAKKTYAGPDAASAPVTGTCRDKAGNQDSASFAVKYDATAPQATATPSRQPNAKGWFNSSLSVDFSGADETSGIASCDPGSTYSTPDSATAVLGGACLDRAGNPSAVATFGFKYDSTPPLVASVTPLRQPDRAGWYNRPIGFAVNGQDTMSGLASCPPQSYGGPDSATASFSGTCLDNAGNPGVKAFALKYDATGPETTATADRTPDSNGWFNQALAVSFSGTDAVSGTESCSTPESYTGPDSGEAVIGGICLDQAGNVGLASLSVSYDATAPVVSGAEPSRPSDANGWYNRELVVDFHGSDATSGIGSCTKASYAGPDAAAASVSGTCQDRAGNTSGSLPFPLRFDSTAPTLGELRVKPGNGRAVLTWTTSPDTTLVEIRRGTKRVYSGTATTFTDTGLTNGVRYHYTLASYDEAANSATAAVAATPSGPLVSPASGAVVKAPPRLAWKAAPRATYYHVQLWRSGRILSAWPRGTSFQLRRSWIYNGRRFRLTPGRYRWYVWPGRGRPAQQKFGPQLGSSSFVVR